MTAFENIEIACLVAPTTRQVLDSIRRDEPCRADPRSSRCVFQPGKDDYLLRDQPGSVVCRACPIFDRKLQRMTADWAEWVLAMQEVYT
jgi:hypothetical protein